MRIALLADIHANLSALREVLSHIDRVTQPDALWFLGDLAGYSSSLAFCAHLLAPRVAPGCQVAGNHDRGLTGQLAPAYFTADSWWVLEKRHIPQSQELVPILAALPSYRRPQLKGKEIADIWLIHGRATESEVDNLTGRPSYVYELPPDSTYAEDTWHFLHTKANGTVPCLLLAGHTHYPQLWHRSEEHFPDNKWGRFLDDETRRRASEPIDLGKEPVWLNPGSVGQPRDGDPRTSYAVLDLERNQVVFYRLAYDVADTQQKMYQQGYPASLIKRLEYGR